VRLRLDLRRALGRIDRRALAAVRGRFRESCPAAYESKYWRLERQLLKNLHRAWRLRLHRPPFGLSILDLGTGFGLFPSVCRLYGHRAIGLDLEDEADSLYRLVTGVLGIERLLGSILPREPLPVGDRRFDLVTGFAVLFSNPQGEPWGAGEWRYFLADLAGRRLAPGGRVFLSFNRDRCGRYVDPETEALFHGAGAEIAGRDVYFPTLDPASLRAGTVPAAEPVAAEA
jgi:SAM-dependent methyltransferase